MPSFQPANPSFPPKLTPSKARVSQRLSTITQTKVSRWTTIRPRAGVTRTPVSNLNANTTQFELKDRVICLAVNSYHHFYHGWLTRLELIQQNCNPYRLIFSVTLQLLILHSLKSLAFKTFHADLSTNGSV